MKNFERFINFSDAVMAIAVTLLVLPLVEHATSSSITSYRGFVSSFGNPLFIFLLSFVVICRYWEVHHNLFSNLKSFNTRLFWLNASWLVSIVLIPFTSELLGNSSESVFITSIYIGSLLITSYLGVAIEWEILHSPILQKPSAAKSLRSTYGLVTAIAMTLALAISIMFHDIGLWALLLLVPASYISKALQNKRLSDLIQRLR
jgi:uncharacterized membrane protein